MSGIQWTINKIKDIFSLYTISIFPLPTKNGNELLNGILETFFRDALGRSYENGHCVCYVDIKRSIKIKVYDQSKYTVTVNDCILSCFKDDLVIFDASIEGNNHEINNYRLANAGKAARVCPPRASDDAPCGQKFIDPLRQNKNDP